MARINSNIYSLRKSLKMSMEELGNKIGTTKQTIQKYESGEIKNIPYDKINLLAEALNVTPVELMGFDDMPNVKEVRHLDAEMAVIDFELNHKFGKLTDTEQKEVMQYIDFLLSKH